MVVLRQLTAVERTVASEAIGLFGVSIKNDRQVQEFRRILRGTEAQAKGTCLKALQDFGYLDLSIGPDDLRTLR